MKKYIIQIGKYNSTNNKYKPNLNIILIKQKPLNINWCTLNMQLKRMRIEKYIICLSEVNLCKSNVYNVNGYNKISKQRTLKRKWNYNIYKRECKVYNPKAKTIKSKIYRN